MTLPSQPFLLSRRLSQMTFPRSMCLRQHSCGPLSSGTPMEWRLATSVSSKNAYHLLLIYIICLQGAQ